MRISRCALLVKVTMIMYVKAPIALNPDKWIKLHPVTGLPDNPCFPSEVFHVATQTDIALIVRYGNSPGLNYM